MILTEPELFEHFYALRHTPLLVEALIKQILYDQQVVRNVKNRIESLGGKNEPLMTSNPISDGMELVLKDELKKVLRDTYNE